MAPAQVVTLAPQWMQTPVLSVSTPAATQSVGPHWTSFPLKDHVFACSQAGHICRTQLVEHSIETLDSRPVCQALHQHPVAYLPLINNYAQEMQDNGIIEPRAGSEWVYNIVLV